MDVKRFPLILNVLFFALLFSSNIATYTATIQLDGQTLLSAPATLRVFPSLSDHPENLLAHWTFDGLINGNIAPDSTGNFDGTVVNAAITTPRIGSGALQVTSNAYMQVSSTLSFYLAGKPFSLLWWHRAEGRVPAYAKDKIIILPPFEIYVSADANSQGQISISEPYQITIPNYDSTELYGNWRHYALIFDGTRCFFYEDSILRADWSMAGRGGVQANGNGPSLWIGSPGEFNHFRGSIDDVRIYDIALSPSQIASLGPPPHIEIKHNPSDYRVGIGRTVTFTAEGFPVATYPPLLYEWEVDGNAISSFGNTVSVTGTSSPGIARVRAKISAGNLATYTREATIVTVLPEPALLLHYDFENDGADVIRDSAGSFHGQPHNIRHLLGRVDKYAAGFEGSYIRVPATTTPLELVGTPYTIAWWIRFERPLVATASIAESPQPWGEIIFDLGPQFGPAGYSAQLLGNRMESIHKSVSPAVLSAVFDIFNMSGWMHFTITYDGETRRLYMNGKELSSAPTAQPIIGSGAHDLYLGNSTEAIANGDLFGYPWTRNALGGLLDDFRIYSYALTPNQIGALVDVPPPLVITAASGRIGLTWPETSEAVFTLEQSTSLGADAQWSPVTPAPIAADGRFQVVLNSAADSAFFRLKK